MAHDHVGTVKNIYEAFGRGDIPAILQHLSHDVLWEHDSPGFGLPWLEPRQGHAGFVEFVQQLMTHTVLHRLEPLNFLTGGNQVAVPLQLDLEVKRSGGRVRDLEVHLFTFNDDGLVCRFAHVLDRHAQVCEWRGVKA